MRRFEQGFGPAHFFAFEGGRGQGPNNRSGAAQIAALPPHPVMPGLGPPRLNVSKNKDVDGRHVGERSDAVLSNGYARHDGDRRSYKKARAVRW